MIRKMKKTKKMTKVLPIAMMITCQQDFQNNKIRFSNEEKKEEKSNKAN